MMSANGRGKSLRTSQWVPLLRLLQQACSSASRVQLLEQPLFQLVQGALGGLACDRIP